MKLLKHPIFFLYLVLFSCTTEEVNTIDNNSTQELSKFETSTISDIDSLLAKNQTFELDCSKDSLIVLKEGVKILFPKNSFVNNKNRRIEFATINVTEFLSIESMILGNLSTCSDSSLLVSNGMIYIEALDGSEKLSLSKNKELTVSFPKNGESKPYQLFYGDKNEQNGTVNWNMAKKKTKPQKKIIKRYNYTIDYSGYVTKSGNFVPTYQFQDKTIKDDFFTYFIEKFNPSKKSMDWFAKNHLLFIDSDTSGVHIKIHFNKDLTVKKVDYSIDENSFTTELTEFIKQMPKINYKTVSNYNLSNPNFYFVIYALAELDKQDYQRQLDENILNNNNVTTEDLDYYVYAVTNLGWINCDRFYQYEETTNLITSNENGLNYFLIFNELKSLLKPNNKTENELKFNRIPLEKEVNLIGFKMEENHVLFTKNQFITSEEKIILNKPLTLSFKEFKQELALLKNN